jgi:hypothetical protein
MEINSPQNVTIMIKNKRVRVHMNRLKKIVDEDTLMVSEVCQGLVLKITP